jgi:uncharacterized protein (DUF488 family)
MKLYTIGFTHKSAEAFFSLLSNSGVKRVIDIRLYNKTQLAGFTKENDLRYFLKVICDIEYQHELNLAPSKEMLDEYVKNKGSWEAYEKSFINLLSERAVEDTSNKDDFYDACLLCSEDEPDFCHRILVARYLNDKWGGIEVCHLPIMEKSFLF